MLRDHAAEDLRNWKQPLLDALKSDDLADSEATTRSMMFRRIGDDFMLGGLVLMPPDSQDLRKRAMFRLEAAFEDMNEQLMQAPPASYTFSN
jgi:hypothetical protein